LDPDLSSHGVLGCAEKCFDAQVLFDPLEEANKDTHKNIGRIDSLLMVL